MKTKQFSRVAGLLMTLLFLISISTARAQPGSSCKDAVALPTGTACEQGIQTADTVYWFYFVPDSTTAIVRIMNHWQNDSAMTNLAVFTGEDCDNLSQVSIQRYSLPGLGALLTGLTPQQTYYLKVTKGTNADALFDVCINYGNSTFTPACPCPTSLIDPNNTCSLVCNGDFDYYATAPWDWSQIDFACPWFMLAGGSSDFFHSVSAPLPVGQPANYAGWEYSYLNSSNGGYAGFIAFDQTWSSMYDSAHNGYFGSSYYMVREYICQQMNAPLVNGQKYKISFYISLTDNSGWASRGIGALFSQNIPSQSNLTGNVIPQATHIYLNNPSYQTNAGGWTQISFVFTVPNNNITYRYLTIGQFNSDAVNSPIAVTPLSTGNGTNLKSYYYVDRVSVAPDVTLAAIATTPVCSGQPAILQVSNTNVSNPTPITFTWTPGTYLNATTGSMVVATPVYPPSSYTYTAIGTLANYGGCTMSTSVGISVNQSPVANAGNDITICPGQSATLIGSATNATTTNWYPVGGSLLCSGCTSVVVTPTQTTQYVFQALETQNNCWDTDTITVIVQPLQGQIVFPAYSTTCAGAINFSVSGGPYTSYTWTSNGSPTSGSNSTFSSNWNATSNNGLLSVYVTNSLGCSGTFVDTIPGCCTNGSQNNLLNTQTSNISTQYPGLGSYSGGYFEIDGQTFSVNGLFTVDQNMRWKGCNVYMGMDAKIVISPGIKFEITASAGAGTKIKACDYMWDGIFVDGTNSLSEILVNAGSVIEDAKNAIVSIKGGKFTIAGTSSTQRVKFNKNKIAIHVQKHTSTHPGTVKNTIISCDYATGQPGYTSGWTYTGSVCRPPYSQKSYFGILIDDNVGITIGDSSSNTQRNLLERLRYGIYSRSSTVKIFNNDLKYIQGTPQPLSSPMQDGMAIYANGGLWPQAYTITVGNIGTVNAGNSFINCTYGVRADSYLNSSIQNNSFDTLLATGITTVGCKMRTQFINMNAFNEYKTAIQVVDPYKSTVTISNNSMNQINQPNPTTFGNAGIVVLNAVQTNVTLKIFNNAIRKCRIGIWVSRVKNPKIYDNSQITFFANQPATPAAPAMGIKIEGCTNALVKNNTVSYSVTPTSNQFNRLFGIHVTDCFNDSVYKNTLTRMGSSIFLKGADNPSLIACNTMTTCYLGVNFNSGGPTVSVNDQIRWQNVTPTPTGNTWSGCTVDIAGGIDPNNSINWNRNNSYSPSHSMTLLSFVNNTPTNLGNTSDQCGSLFVAPGPADQRDYALAGIAKTPRTYDTLNNEFQYIDRVNAYRMLRDNPSWLALNHADDSYYQNFYSSESSSSIGKLADAEDAIEQDQLQAAAILVNSITPVGKPEENRQAVMQVYLDTWAKASPVLSDAQKNILQPITWQYSVSGGNAVFDARNMLYEEVNDSTMIRIEAPTALTGILSENGGLYPNPTTGDMTLVWQLAETEQGEVEVYDLSGRIVLRATLQNGNTHRLNTGMLQNGTYMLRIVINGHPALTGRIVVIKQD